MLKKRIPEEECASKTFNITFPKRNLLGIHSRDKISLVIIVNCTVATEGFTTFHMACHLSDDIWVMGKLVGHTDEGLAPHVAGCDFINALVKTFDFTILHEQFVEILTLINRRCRSRRINLVKRDGKLIFLLM